MHFGVLSVGVAYSPTHLQRKSVTGGSVGGLQVGGVLVKSSTIVMFGLITSLQFTVCGPAVIAMVPVASWPLVPDGFAKNGCHWPAGTLGVAPRG